MTTRDFSFWLLAREADEAALSAILRELSTRFSAQHFQPHLTLAGDITSQASPLRAALPAIADGIAPVEAAVAAIDIGESFFRSFYARFPVLPALATLRSRAHAAAEKPENSPFLPHVSLLYGPVDPAAKEAARQEVEAELKGRPILFDRVALVTSSDTTPIEDWQIIATAPLRG